MPDDDLTDEEAVEYYRAHMQDAVDRAAEAWRAGKSVTEFFEQDVAEGHHAGHERVRVLASDLREVGSFLVDFPADFPGARYTARKHWVYERIADKTMFVLHLPTRNRLQRLGYTDVDALIDDPKQRN